MNKTLEKILEDEIFENQNFEGEGNVQIQDTSEGTKLGIEILGNSKQEGEPSKEVLIENKSCGDDSKSININVETPNLYDVNDIQVNDGSVDEDGWITLESNGIKAGRTDYKFFRVNSSQRLKPNTNYWMVLEIKECSGSGGLNINENNDYTQIAKSTFYQISNLKAGNIYIYEATTKEDFSQSRFILNTFITCSKTQKGRLAFRWSLFEKEVTKDNFIYYSYGYQDISIPVQKPFKSIGKNKDTFIYQNNKRYERHIIKRIDSYSNEEIKTDYVSNTGELSEGAVVDYVLDEPELIECTEEQNKALNKLVQATAYDDITNIICTDEIPCNFKVNAKMSKIKKLIGGK